MFLPIGLDLNGPVISRTRPYRDLNFRAAERRDLEFVDERAVNIPIGLMLLRRVRGMGL